MQQGLATVENDLTSAAVYEKNIKRIEDIISEIIGEKLEFLVVRNPIRVFIKKNGTELTVNALPDGIMSLLSWISDMLLRLCQTPWYDNSIPLLDRKIILLLDEIDVHLHPKWQRRVVPVIQRLFKNAQIFLTTHSPFVIGSADNVWVHHLVKEGDYVVAKPAVESSDADSYSTIADELFGIKNDFGVLIEDKMNEWQELKTKLKSYKPTSFETIDVEDRNKCIELITFFKNQKSIEIDNIMGREVSQLSRFLNIDLLSHVTLQ
ncbi:MAG: hypothetical protein EBX41_07800 [Chitinophagia bacterium]|nr:hypothetical protein [Chitinophagia bacterium]